MFFQSVLNIALILLISQFRRLYLQLQFSKLRFKHAIMSILLSLLWDSLNFQIDKKMESCIQCNKCGQMFCYKKNLIAHISKGRYRGNVNCNWGIKCPECKDHFSHTEALRTQAIEAYGLDALAKKHLGRYKFTFLQITMYYSIME